MIYEVNSKKIEELIAESAGKLAKVISFLNPYTSASILEKLRLSKQIEVIKQIVNLGPITKTNIFEIDQYFSGENLLSSTLDFTNEYVTAGGLDTIVEILKNIDVESEKLILKTLDQEDSILAKEIRSEMVNFEDLIIIFDDEILRKFLTDIDFETLGKAIKHTDQLTLEKIESALSENKKSELKTIRLRLGSVSLEEVFDAKRNIKDHLLVLADLAEIKLPLVEG